MHLIKKNLIALATFIGLSFLPTMLHAGDFITIDDPADYYSVSGEPLTINGTSSQPNFTVRLWINTTNIGSATTDIYGNWSFTYNNLPNESYTLTAELVNSYFEVLATDTNSFTINNADTITITAPEYGDLVFFNPTTIGGSSSLSNTTVKVYLDNNLIATTTTDAYGDWEISYTITSNGTHAITANLVDDYGYTIASDAIGVNAQIPILFPSGKNLIRVLDGYIPTTGSGSGSGYTYSVSGSIMTINFTPAFSSTPSMIATGQRSSGGSTVTISSISASAVSISFSTGTQQVHFTATALL